MAANEWITKGKTWWNGLDSKQKGNMAKGGSIGAVVLFLVLGSLGQPTEVEQKPVALVRKIKLDEGVLQKSIFARAEQMMDEEKKAREDEARRSREEISQLRQEIEATRKMVQGGGYPGQYSEGGQEAQTGYPQPPMVPAAGGADPRMLGRGTPMAAALNGQPAQAGQPPKARVQKLGGITIVEATASEREKAAAEKELVPYLPVAIMPATLLNAIYAKTGGDAASNPQPVFLRISMPAILPNNVKKNLKGCFVVAEGTGDLSTERVDMRTKLISCIDFAGKAVIEEKLEGAVYDSDGVLGISGKVVAKFGSNLARTALAGFIGGFGELASQSAQTTVTDTTGNQTQQLDSKQITTGALGSGLSNATSELEKFYLDLARQSMPVVEILPGKKVDIGVFKGTELKLKNYNL